MKKLNLKRQLAKVLAVSMGVSVLTPALPTFAASHANINFDLGIYAAYEGVTLPTLEASETQKVKEKYSTLPVDTAANGQSATSVTPDTNLEMPWWDVEWMTFNALSNDNKLTATKPTATWNGVAFDFPGYSFAGWYAEDYASNTAQKAINKLPKEFPYRETTYYARYITDGTKYKFTVEHNQKAGTNAPINNVTETTQSYVLVNRQARPKVIPGYKAELTDANIKLYEPNTTDVVAGKTYTDYGFVKEADASGYNPTVTGEMVNKDIKVTYEYLPDTDKKFSVVSEHNVLDANGNILTTIVDRKSFSVEEAITGIAPQAGLITPVAVQHKPDISS